jgi:hydrogenase maturation protease
MTQKTNTILIVGVGNTLRGDDGIGAYICSCMELLKIPGVQTLQVQQLDTALLDEMMQANHIIIADASMEGKAVDFFKVNENDPIPVSSSHHMSGPLLLQTAQTIYQKEMSMMICAVAGYRFGMKEKLSARAKKNADNAVAIITEWINKNN